MLIPMKKRFFISTIIFNSNGNSNGNDYLNLALLVTQTLALLFFPQKGELFLNIINNHELKSLTKMIFNYF